MDSFSVFVALTFLACLLGLPLVHSRPLRVRRSDMSPINADVIQTARKILADAERVLVITGAGMSADSGVPTFRGEGERWRDRHFTELATPEAFRADPRLIWEWYLYRRGVVATCAPHEGHRHLAEWAKAHPGVTLVTQNVDGLHEQAGHPNVHRIHGSLWHNQCTGCGRVREERSLAYEENFPLSPCCGILERPAIVWFGETLAVDARRAGTAASVEAQAVLVVGTSGIVSTADLLVSRARQARACIIDVNVDDSLVAADMVVRGRACDILPQIL